MKSPFSRVKKKKETECPIVDRSVITTYKDNIFKINNKIIKQIESQPKAA